MRRWVTAATSAARVADRPSMWAPAALAWIVTVGWIPLVVAVAQPPTAAELTFFGAGLATSGTWPLNVVLIVVGACALALVATSLAAIGTAALIGRIEGRPSSPADAARIFGASVVFALPAVFGVLVTLVGLTAIGPAEFNRPESAIGPVARTVLRLAPLLAFTGLLLLTGTALAAVAGRVAVHRASLVHGLVSAPVAARRIGAAAWIHALVGSLAALAYLVVATILLGVLWGPIEVRLGAGEVVEPRTGLLLVGFVAIWLCLVTGGGALHAWSAATWSRLLGDTTSMDAATRGTEWRP